MLTYGDRVAVVTGGTGSIGLAIANAFLSVDLKVAVLGLDPLKITLAREALDLYQEGASFWQCDVSNVESLRRVLTEVHDFHGSIDILVNCAGVVEVSTFDLLSEDTWSRVMDVNLKGTVFATQGCLPFLRSASNPRVINISSNAGRMGGISNGMAYTAAKGGIISLTYGLATKLAESKITVNCIAPGPIETEMIRARGEAGSDRLRGLIPLGRLGTSEEVAAAALYFASVQAAFTTGAVLDVNGGLFVG